MDNIKPRTIYIISRLTFKGERDFPLQMSGSQENFKPRCLRVERLDMDLIEVLKQHRYMHITGWSFQRVPG